MPLPGLVHDFEGRVVLRHDEEPWYNPDTGHWHLGPFLVTAEVAMRWRDEHRMGTDEWYRECVEALDGA